MALFPNSRLQDINFGRRAENATYANAIYKLDKLVLVNCDIFEEYLETFRVRE